MKITNRRDLRIPSYAEFIEARDEYPPHIIVQKGTSNLLTEATSLLTEGNWVESSEAGYWMRKDAPKFDYQQLHVHIAPKKHINAKSKQVSWNQDGTRHDKMTFNNNFKGLEKAKEIARNVLNLGSDVILEEVSADEGKLLLSNIDLGVLPSKARFYFFTIKAPESNLLKS